MDITLIVILFLALLVTGVPVGYIFYFVGGLYLVTNGVNLGAVVQRMGSSMNSISAVAGADVHFRRHVHEPPEPYGTLYTTVY